MSTGFSQPSTDIIATSGLSEEEHPWIRSTCAYCGVGCGIEIKQQPTHDGEPKLEIRGDQRHPANFGRLCSKGLALGETLSTRSRLLHPSIHGQQTDWATALSAVAKGFEQVIAEHGPDSVALYVSGQLLTEDYYVANKLMKGFIGSSNIDTNSRLCMSSSVAGHKRAFGSDTVPNVYADLEQADLVVITGSNMAWCHPVLFQRLKAAKAQRPDMKVVVIDPRQTDTCDLADLHLAIHPGTDVALFNGLLLALHEQGLLYNDYQQQHTQGLADALSSAQQDAADHSTRAQLLGVSPEDLTAFYTLFGQTEKTLTLYSQGVNQSSAGVDKVNAILNCHLATGRIGKEGCGPFSLTGQPNAMGGREVGGLANMLAAHMEFGDADAHQAITEFWQSPNLSPTLSQKPGLKAVDLFEAIHQGKIKAVWIMATNPVVSLPNANRVEEALKKCDLVVVSDCVNKNDTLNYAHIALPAQGWSEKSGTVTNSERRISRQKRLLAPQGEAQPDWWIISEVAKCMGFGEAFDYQHEADIFREYSAMTGLLPEQRRDLRQDALKTLTNDDYDQMPPQQWPLRQPDSHTHNKRLFADGQFFTSNGKGNIVAVTHRPPQTQTTDTYPFALNTGRLRDQWHTMTRTGLAARLGAHQPEPSVSLHPDDAQTLKLKDKDIARLHNHLGETLLRVRTDTRCQQGQVFVPIHWTNTLAAAARISDVVSPEVDPISGQPESKFTPVAVEPWHFDSAAMIASKTELDCSSFAQKDQYWVQQTIDQGFVYFFAAKMPAQELWGNLQTLTSSTMLDGSLSELAFHNDQAGTFRRARFQQQNAAPASGLYDYTIVAPTLDGDALSWLVELFSTENDQALKRSLITGTAEGTLAQGKIICACKKVGEKTLRDAIMNDKLHQVDALSQATNAGTGCGSCVPELRQLIDSCLASCG